MANTPIHSVKKAFDLLSILAFDDLSRQGISVTELARRMGMPANSTHNLLQTMVQCHFVAQTPSSRYIIGPKCLQIGKLHMASAQTAEAIRPLAEALSDDLQESIVFAVMLDGRRIPLLTVDPARTIKVDLAHIPESSIYAVPTGRILVAYADAAELTRVVERWGLPGVHWDAIADEETFAHARQAIRSVGSVTQVPDGHELASFACPVLAENGTLLGALGCYAPLYRCPDARQRTIRSRMLAAAPAIGRVLSLQSASCV